MLRGNDNSDSNLNLGHYQVETLVHNFSQTLRRSGFLVGVKETSDAIKSLNSFDILNKEIFFSVLRSALVSDKNEWSKFTVYFDSFWKDHIASEMKVTSNISKSKSEKPPVQQDTDSSQSKKKTLSDEVEDQSRDGEDMAGHSSNLSGASSAENLETIDINNITDPNDLEEILKLTDRLARNIRYKLSRRKVLSNKKKEIFIRKVLHKSVATGGVPINLFHKAPKKRPFKLVILLDVSGSMDNYSQFFMRFMYGLLGSFKKADAFIFHTKLVQITSLLQDRNPIKVMERMSLIAQGWSGGTKIGSAIELLNKEYSKGIITSRTMVIVVSDGYDTGEPELLASEMHRLKRKVKRIVWLNPMLGWERYEPTSAAMNATLPHIDLFASAHNLQSLAALEPEFARI